MDLDADTSAEEVLSRAVWSLYGVAPADFVAERKAWAKRLREAGHREVATQVGALRKPSVAAATINGMVRAQDPAVTALHDVGTRLRHAHATLDASGLSVLRSERDAVLAEWVAAAHRHAPGGELTATLETEVRDTAVAVLADADASEVATSGTLTRALRYSGFGEVDVADAVARTSTGVVLTRIMGGSPEPDDTAEEDQDGTATDEHGTALAALEHDLELAEEAVSTARAVRRQAAQEDAEAEREETVALAQVEQAQRLLDAARQQLDRASSHREQTGAALSDADDDLRRRRRERDATRSALEEAEDT